MKPSGSVPSYAQPGKDEVQFGVTSVNSSQRSCQPPPSALTALDDEVLAARVGQEARHRQAGMSGTHDQDVHGVG